MEMMEFAIVRYEKGTGGKVTVGTLWGVDQHGAEVLGMEFLSPGERQTVTKDLYRTAGPFFASSADYQYSAEPLGNTEDRPVLGEEAS